MSGGSSIEFASLSDPHYATDEHKWVPSHSYWVRKEEVNGKTRTVHWIKCMLEKGAVSSANDLKTSLEDGGMTLEIKAKRPRAIYDPSSHYDEELDALWGKDRTDYNRVNKRKKDEEDEIHSQQNFYKKNHEWNVFRKPLDKQCDETQEIYYFKIHSPTDGSGQFIKIGLVEAQTDVYIPVLWLSSPLPRTRKDRYSLHWM